MIDRQAKIPLYKQIYNIEKNKIISGEYKNDEYMPSENALSSNYGVERATVRRALELLVKDKLVIKIPGTGTKISYNSFVKNNSSQSNSNQSNNIAFILSADYADKITQPFISEVFYYLEKECKQENYNLFYTNISLDYDLSSLTLTKNVKGIVWMSYIDKSIILRSKEHKIPSVLVSNYIPGFTSILIDNIVGSCETVEYLYSVGHKKIAFINGLRWYLNSIERLEGYKRGLANCGIEFDARYVKEGDWTFDSGYLAMKQLLEEGLRPTAVFSANDIMAAGVIKAAVEAGISIPDDISVIGFDNIEMCNYTNPPLSTVGVDTSLIAKQVMKNLKEIMQDFNNYQPFKVVIPTKLVIRKSVK